MFSQTIAERRADLVWQQLGILLAGRLVFNTAFRVVYPLLPLLAVGLGVDLQTASLLVTVQVAASLLSPLGGLITDSYGERATLLVGLALFTAGAVLCALAGAFWPFLAGYALVGLGTALYMPAVQTYASNRSAYSARGRVLGGSLRENIAAGGSGDPRGWKSVPPATGSRRPCSISSPRGFPGPLCSTPSAARAPAGSVR